MSKSARKSDGGSMWLLQSGVIGIVLALIALAILILPGRQNAPSPSGGGQTISREAQLAASEDLQEGQRLYDTYCGACHGFDGEGQTPEQATIPAPPHDSTGHTWHHADGLLIQIVRQGSPVGAMPAFTQEQISDQELQLIYDYIRLWWLPEQQDFQEEVTRQGG